MREYNKKIYIMEIFDLVNGLCYDIKEKIFIEVNEIKHRGYIQRNKFYPVLEELRQLNRELTRRYEKIQGFIPKLQRANRMSSAYFDFNIYMDQEVVQTQEELEQYYSDLDFILDCKCNTEIDIAGDRIYQSYRIKDNLKWKYHNLPVYDDDYDYDEDALPLQFIPKEQNTIEHVFTEWIKFVYFTYDDNEIYLPEETEDLILDIIDENPIPYTNEELKNKLHKMPLMELNIY